MTEIKIRPDYVTFDCYGTLINFEIRSVTRRLLGDQLTDEQFEAFVPAFRAYRYDQVCGDSYYAYEQVLEDSFTRVCRRWGLRVPEGSGKEFGDAVRSWGPHADVPAPLKTHGRRVPAGDPVQRRRRASWTSPSRGWEPTSTPSTPRSRPGPTSPATGRSSTCSTAWGRSRTRSCTSRPTPATTSCRASDLGITNTVLLDRGYDPPSPSYGYVRVESLDELNTLLGL